MGLCGSRAEEKPGGTGTSEEKQFVYDPEDDDPMEDVFADFARRSRGVGAAARGASLADRAVSPINIALH